MPIPLSVPARGSHHARLRTGQCIRITQSEGPQVVDTWAFAIPSKGSDKSEFPAYTYLSPTHTRSKLLKISLSVGDVLVSNTRSPMLTLIDDTSPGIHDLLFAACDKYRYAQLGVAADIYHPSCADNLRTEVYALSFTDAALEGLGSQLGIETGKGRGWTPDPVNLFMNVSVAELGGGKAGTGEMKIEAPRSQKGDFVVLRAEMELVVVISACPMDLNDVNGGVCRGVKFEVL